ncbi:MAG: flagellar FlbD family protein [Nakamurella sp.]
MLLLTRLNGPVFALNPDLIERADATPDTVITLVNGTRYVVTESIAELSQLVRDYRAETAAAAYRAPTERRVISTHTDRAANDVGKQSRGTVVELRPGEL